MKELPEVVEGSSEDEEEEADRELVEKVKRALLGMMSSGFHTAITRCLWGLGALPGTCGGQGIIGCSQELGALLDAHRGWDVARCLRGPGALSGACRAWEYHRMLMGTRGITRCS